MRLIDRYLLRQLLGPTLFATAALTLVALLSQSLSALDLIVNQRQSALVFAKITLLAMPQLINMVLPIALFVAALVALNRLHTEQEIVVCFAGGISRSRVIAPAMRLACTIAFLALLMNLFVQPLSLRAMRQSYFAVNADIAATLVREGQFTEPIPGLTVYAESLDSGGLIHNLFIHHTKDDGSSTTFTADEGRLTKRDGVPVLVMHKGATQEFSRSGVLNYLTFDDYPFDLTPLTETEELIHYKPSDRFLHELLFPDLQQDWERRNRDRLLAEGVARIATPLYNIAFMAMALSAIIGGGFSRLGYGRRIAITASAAVGVRILGFVVQAGCESEPWLNVLQFVIPVTATVVALRAVFRQKVSRTIDITRTAPRLARPGGRMTRVGRIERYVLGRTLSAVGVALAVITAVIALVQFVDLSRTVGVRADVGVTQLFWLTLLRCPAVILVLAPFVFLFGGIGAFVGLNRSSELVAMRAAGVSAWRFILPSAFAAFLIGVVTVTVLNPIAAALNARYESERGQLMDTARANTPHDVWLRQGDDRNQIVIHAKGRATIDGTVRLRGVSLFIYQKDARGRPEFKRRLEAGSATLMPGFWRLTDVREAGAGENSVRSESMSILSTLDAEAAMERFASPEAIAFWRLPGAIRQTELAGFSAAGYRLRYEQLLASPLLFAAMSILAAAFSLRLSRLGGLAGLAGAGVALGFVMFFFNEFSGALAGGGVIPLYAAAWAPPLIALLSGLTLLCYTEDG